jgi:hypothetical protein
MYTKGMDVSLQGRILDKQLKWEVGINAGSYRNKVTALPGNPVITSYAGATYITQPGSAANLFYGYKTQGIYRTNAAAQKEGYTVNGLPATGGDVRFTDIDNNHIIDEHDRQVIGNPAPDLFGGISNRLSFKRWTLDVLFTFSLGNDVYNYTRQQLESGSTTNNQTLALVNRWRADGQITDIPAVAMGDPKGNARFSDRWIEDGSYLRLRTLSVSYDIPVNARFLKYAKVYATGNNLLTFTKYLGYDPEFSAGNSIFTQGVDTGLEPLFRSVQLGVRVGL